MQPKIRLTSLISKTHDDSQENKAALINTFPLPTMLFAVPFSYFAHELRNKLFSQIETKSYAFTPPSKRGKPAPF